MSVSTYSFYRTLRLRATSSIVNYLLVPCVNGRGEVYAVQGHPFYASPSCYAAQISLQFHQRCWQLIPRSCNFGKRSYICVLTLQISGNNSSSTMRDSCCTKSAGHHTRNLASQTRSKKKGRKLCFWNYIPKVCSPCRH
jgi:hypothetical protein